ncbi:hypothetical protein SAMN06269117_1064 [Balnearium lithotrophicum]|uniref:Uncharacterized protein n=1 Tax=Balnearium lithotrophicum TaxID=223788 RepID=A0A521BMB2_9BACT|nr:hypothetical protein [Balnearium lithotrophicum]SMO47911.1 hypothetical protein SAMN06269117_1064 [Balnearium lithotrophicum]
MDDSFSLLGLDRELCERAVDEGEEVTVKHYVFDDLLDTSEKLTCSHLEVDENFSIFNYLLKKEKLSFFSRSEEIPLGCYVGYKNGSLFTFEDFNFKIQSLDEFTLLVEAIEVTTGKAFHFELCNLCQLPEKLSSEMDVALTIYSNRVKRLPPLSHFDQVADENRELLKLAIKGNEKAREKLERSLGEEETVRLLGEFSQKPEELFDTCILSDRENYTVIGIVTSVSEIGFEGKSLYSVDLFSEDLELKLLTPEYPLSEGERFLAVGKMYGVATV